jgi:hypothetical protein
VGGRGGWSPSPGPFSPLGPGGSAQAGEAPRKY